MSGLFAAEGGYQEFVLKGGEWAVLWLSAAAALLAIAVGFFLVRSVMAADEGSPKMKEIALAIQEGAWAYLKRQFKTAIAPRTIRVRRRWWRADLQQREQLQHPQPRHDRQPDHGLRP